LNLNIVQKFNKCNNLVRNAFQKQTSLFHKNLTSEKSIQLVYKSIHGVYFRVFKKVKLLKSTSIKSIITIPGDLFWVKLDFEGHNKSFNQ